MYSRCFEPPLRERCFPFLIPRSKPKESADRAGLDAEEKHRSHLFRLGTSDAEERH